jgi:hypothetical protein
MRVMGAFMFPFELEQLFLVDAGGNACTGPRLPLEVLPLAAF